LTADIHLSGKTLLAVDENVIIDILSLGVKNYNKKVIVYLINSIFPPDIDPLTSRTQIISALDFVLFSPTTDTKLGIHD